MGVGTRAGCHGEGAVPPWAQLAHVRGVEQLLGPQQHPVADLEHGIDPARVELRPPLRSACAAAISARTVAPIARTRCAQCAGVWPAASWSRGGDRGSRGCAPRSTDKGARPPPSVDAALLMANTVSGRRSSLRPSSAACAPPCGQAPTENGPGRRRRGGAGRCSGASPSGDQDGTHVHIHRGHRTATRATAVSTRSDYGTIKDYFEPKAPETPTASPRSVNLK